MNRGARCRFRTFTVKEGLFSYWPVALQADPIQMHQHDSVVPYSGSPDAKKNQVSRMFNNIAASYDLLNRLLSFGIDIWWRKRAIKILAASSPKIILDVATGTADLALEAVSLRPEKITGIDISEGMLEKGREKIRKKNLEKTIELHCADSENLPFEDHSFDAVMVSFGVRNFENLDRGLAEIYRVIRPGGMLMVLEFSKPANPAVRFFYNLYNRSILPAAGRLLSGDSSAYSYLPESVKAFPEGRDFLEILTKQQFQQTKALPLTFGISTIYTGLK